MLFSPLMSWFYIICNTSMLSPCAWYINNQKLIETSWGTLVAYSIYNSCKTSYGIETWYKRLLYWVILVCIYINYWMLCLSKLMIMLPSLATSWKWLNLWVPCCIWLLYPQLYNSFDCIWNLLKISKFICTCKRKNQVSKKIS